MKAGATDSDFASGVILKLHRVDDDGWVKVHGKDKNGVETQSFVKNEKLERYSTRVCP